ncbi:hypothetical protein COW36_23725 [bacterium (Candidatus Blackallbacteria) CG17_big_fil_post_rev_8_21_14_2_50_48_46]|uniref:Lipoprotein n=1 Tax=bacterium (Candidatus Blackallbacteria) CG17_big_fil_post_rev_8_21_14_2_50_48_46 TaxID=2014261 RepID=A0A2M7FXQ0_9BACT|nr:MAG: hypothetical protein COW64_17935 [bacterium (Candidatus Blackallbacteria) CG18_big_fil_WC_8_21_14_2_50_49_26]PIW14047.1 MAG: hypothetical protein COW36_23725 [bacterium (Candidatus Blackallbacteria) CG17_big_fil_post_rev_8_21_14_2_50_48_46]PIW50733.1 MAG: hypothetical protein COW20_01500 [bacterium (Candidatus Blackallbacteria) CG13_big_fil_rev_8_21_14_2_50_49_14]
MKRNTISLTLLAMASLTGCWVPQVIQGVRPELIKPVASAAPDEYKISTEEGLIALATRMISIAQETSRMLVTTRAISTRRQQVENFIYFNVKSSNSSGLPDWFFNGTDYTTFDPVYRSNYTLSFKNGEGKPYAFDVLAISNYGAAEPFPAKAFPADFAYYELSVAQTPSNTLGTLSLTLKGEVPRQIPLRGDIETSLSGSGENTGHPALGKIGLRVDGKANLEGTLTQGQISFDTVFQGKAYNGFGTVDASGFTNTVDIQQNGQTVMQIQRVDKRWNVLRDNQVVATGD